MKRQGFTLIEVVVSLAIFALCAVILTQSFLGGMVSLATFKYEDEDEENLNFIYNQITQLESKNDVQNGGQINSLTKGTVKWEGQVEQTHLLDVHKLMLKMTFVDDQKREAREDFYLYRPKWSQPSDRENLLREKKQLFRS